LGNRSGGHRLAELREYSGELLVERRFDRGDSLIAWERRHPVLKRFKAGSDLDADDIGARC